MQEAFRLFRAQSSLRGSGDPPSIAILREKFAPGGRAYPLPADVEIRRAVEREWSAWWVVPRGVDLTRVVLMLHGGGFTLGDLQSHGELAARIARASDARLCFLEYRLTPEHPFPAAVQDAIACWHWLRTHEGLAPRAIALAGDSAGGGLALSLMTSLSARGESLPCAAALMSPFTDATVSGASIEERSARDPIFTPDFMRKIAADYLAGADPQSPLASPLFATLRGLPPLLVQVGSEELLFSDSERLVQRAREQNVDVTFEVGEGLLHVYQSVADAPEAQAATDRMGAFLQRCFARHRR